MTITELYNTLVHSKKTGTCGLDGIDGKILKLFVPAVSDTQTYVYSLCIQKCHAPAAFKQAKVIPLSKSGKRSDPKKLWANFCLFGSLKAISETHKHVLAHFIKTTYFTLTNQGSEKTIRV